jgi:parallel beta-helix repeat protein
MTVTYVRAASPVVIGPKPYVDVRAYGAVADGTTDDSAAFTAADAALVSAGGGTLYAPEGTYVVTNLAPSSKTRWHGEPGTILKHKASATTSCLSIGDAVTDCLVTDFTFDGNSANISANVNTVQVGGTRNAVERLRVYDADQDAITVRASARSIRISHCHVYKVNAAVSAGRIGIGIAGSGVGTETQYVLVEGCFVYDTTNEALGIVGVGIDVEFRGNVTGNSGGDGIAAYDDLNLRVVCADNIIDTAANNGIHVGGTDVVVTGNEIRNITQRGIHIASDPNNDPTVSVGATVVGNQVKTTTNGTNGHGIMVHRYTDATVSGNTVNTLGNHGISITDCARVAVTGNTVRDAAGQGIRIEGSQEVTVTGNVTSSNTSDGVKLLQFIRDGGSPTVQSSDVAVVGNVISGNGGWGILATNTTTRLEIGANTFLSNTSGLMSLVGTNHIDASQRRFMSLKAQALLAESFPCIQIATGQLMIDGTVYYVMLADGLREGDIVTGAVILCTTTAGTLTLSKVGLYDSALDRLALSADQGQTWAVAGKFATAFTAPYTVTADGAHYVGVVAKASSGALPTLGRGSSVTQITTPIGAGVRPSGAQTGQTDLPDPGTIAAGGFGFWVAAY